MKVRSKSSGQSVRAGLAVFCLAVLASSGALGQGAGLQARLDKLLSHKDVWPWKVSVLAVDLETGEEIFSSRADRRLIPASNMKLVVTAAAVSRWGMDHEFVTLLARKGQDLVLIGSGDPGFADPVLRAKLGQDPTTVFREWAEIIKKSGLSEAKDIIIDDSIFEGPFVHPHWPKTQLNRWYTAPSGGLNLWENGVWMYKHSRSSAGNLKLLVGPAVTYGAKSKQVPVEHRQVSISDGPKAGRKRAGGVVVRTGQTGKTTAADPGVFFGSVFRAVLAKEGVSVSGQVVRQKLGNAEGRLDEQVEILARASTKLRDIIERANRDSRSLFAECLIKALGNDASGRGSWRSGSAAVGRFLVDRAGAKAEQFVIDDGSGLSRENRLSPRVLLAVLRYMAGRPDAEVFRNSLSIWGRDGTLGRRLNNRALAGRVYAKTGYIRQVRSLSGYVRGKGDKWIAFSILMNKVNNGWRAKQLQQDICLLLVNR